MDLRGGQAWKPRAGWEVTAAVQLRWRWLREEEAVEEVDVFNWSSGDRISGI